MRNVKKTLVWKYFASYPERIMTEDTLYNAISPSSQRPRAEIVEMIDQGLADGWLGVEESDGVTFYYLKPDER